ncbi:MAG: OmpH family outer membrane protein [Bacteroidetes bacterium]|nr:OmpH family outer membrane protein [Bacteroidota bacterium]MBL6962504.1 OmpH family outer membrane protein [Bacteroidota bacterium]
MKAIKNVIAVILIFSAIGVSAQNLKIGHINTSELLTTLPEVEAAKESLQTYQKELEAQVDVLVTEYRKKIETYEQMAANWTNAVKKDKETEIVQLEERIKVFQEEATNELSEKEKELLQPILDRVKAAVEEVAKEKNYDYILDTSAGSVLFSKDSDDITPLVKKKLGLETSNK